MATKPQSTFFKILKGIQSALFFPVNFVASGVAAFASQASHSISVIAAKFLKGFAGRELLWDPFYKSLDDFFTTIYEKTLKQTFFAGTELLKETTDQLEETFEHISEPENLLDVAEKKEINSKANRLLKKNNALPSTEVGQPVQVNQLQNTQQQGQQIN